MQNESLLNTSWKILRHSKLVWIFTFANYMLLTFLQQLGNPGFGPVGLLLCCVGLIWLVVLLFSPIAITITMHYGYLGDSGKFKEILSDVKKYALRWFGLFILVEIPFYVVFLFWFRIANTIEMNFMLVLFISNILVSLFNAFFILYAQLGMIRNNVGIMDAIKHGAQVWVVRPHTKAIISLCYSLTQLIVGLLIVTAQKGFSESVFSISNQEYLALLKPLSVYLPLNIYYALSAPVLYAFMMSTYFEDVSEDVK